MAAFAALASGDTAGAIRMLQSVVSEPVPGMDIVWDLTSPRGMERLTLLRLLASRKDYRKAIEVANVFGSAWPSIHLLYLPGESAGEGRRRSRHVRRPDGVAFQKQTLRTPRRARSRREVIFS